MMTDIPSDRKLIAWGAGPTFEFVRLHAPEIKFDFLVDRQAEKFGEMHHGVPLLSPDSLDASLLHGSYFLITVHSAVSIRSIFDHLSHLGLKFGEDFCDVSYFRAGAIKERASGAGLPLGNLNAFLEIHAEILLGRVDLETTICGSWILDSLIAETTSDTGHAIAEVGAFRCGNAMLQNWRMRRRGDFREYDIFDSFEGFGTLSEFDPGHLANVYSVEMYDYSLTRNLVSLSPSMNIHKGFVPSVFASIPPEHNYDLVFFDCDLYQPALDTFDFFWSRIPVGGYMVFHDYVSYASGWSGVAKAVDEIVKRHNLNLVVVWESTMAIIRKEK